MVKLEKTVLNADDLLNQKWWPFAQGPLFTVLTSLVMDSNKGNARVTFDIKDVLSRVLNLQSCDNAVKCIGKLDLNKALMWEDGENHLRDVLNTSYSLNWTLEELEILIPQLDHQVVTEKLWSLAKYSENIIWFDFWLLSNFLLNEFAWDNIESLLINAKREGDYLIIKWDKNFAVYHISAKFEVFEKKDFVDAKCIDDILYLVKRVHADDFQWKGKRVVLFKNWDIDTTYNSIRRFKDFKLIPFGERMYAIWEWPSSRTNNWYSYIGLIDQKWKLFEIKSLSYDPSKNKMFRKVSSNTYEIFWQKPHPGREIKPISTIIDLEKVELNEEYKDLRGAFY